MASRLGRRAFLNVSRSASSARVAGRNAGRRLMSSSAAEHAPKSDLPWQIGSAAIFGPLCFWLLTGHGQEKAKHTAEHHGAKEHGHSEPAHETAEPIKDDEGTEASAEEVKESVQAAISEDSPKDAQAAEEKEETAPATEEPESPVTESGVPKGEDAESAPVEQKEKPASEAKSSTLENEETGKADLGEARAAAKSGQDPKEASESQ